MSERIDILNEKYKILCKVFGHENKNVIDVEQQIILLSYMEDNVDVDSFFNMAIGDIETCKKLGLDYSDVLTALEKMVDIIHDKKSADDSLTRWYSLASDLGIGNAQYYLGMCYLEGSGVTKNESKAIELLLKSSDQRNASAQYEIGKCYSQGLGVERNIAEAFSWYYRAASNGSALAQNEVGYCYYVGCGVAKDFDNAFKWFMKAANKDLAEAQDWVGECYYYGNGTAKDIQQATEWWRKAAEQGNPDAQNKLGVRYAEGKGVPKDKEKAVEWYTKSAQQGNVFAQNNLGNCYYYGKGVESDYSKAAKWYKKAAKQGNTNAQYRLGVLYSSGYGVEEDLTKAFKWYKLSAEQGNSEAQNALGECYLQGRGTEIDKKEAVKWFNAASEQGNASALKSLGDLYSEGIGVRTSQEKAIEYYTQAAENGDKSAQEILGNLYYCGKDVNQDYSKAVEWYRKASNQGNSNAMYMLGRLYEQGKGVEKNIEEANRLYEAASLRGNTEAKKRIAFLNTDSFIKKANPFCYVVAFLLLGLSASLFFWKKDYAYATGFAMGFLLVFLNTILVKKPYWDWVLLGLTVAPIVARIGIGDWFCTPYIVSCIVLIIVLLYDFVLYDITDRSSSRGAIILIVCGIASPVLLLSLGFQISWKAWQWIIAIPVGVAVFGSVFFFKDSIDNKLLAPLVILIASFLLNTTLYFVIGLNYSIIYRVLSIPIVVGAILLAIECFDDYEKGMGVISLVVCGLGLISAIVIWILIAKAGRQNIGLVEETTKEIAKEVHAISQKASQTVRVTHNTSQWWKWPLGVLGAILIAALGFVPETGISVAFILTIVNYVVLLKCGYPSGYDVFFKCFTYGFAVSGVVALFHPKSDWWARILGFVLGAICVMVFLDFSGFMSYVTAAIQL